MLLLEKYIAHENEELIHLFSATEFVSFDLFFKTWTVVKSHLKTNGKMFKSY